MPKFKLTLTVEYERPGTAESERVLLSAFGPYKYLHAVAPVRDAIASSVEECAADVRPEPSPAPQPTPEPPAKAAAKPVSVPKPIERTKEKPSPKPVKPNPAKHKPKTKTKR